MSRRTPHQRGDLAVSPKRLITTTPGGMKLEFFGVGGEKPGNEQKKTRAWENKIKVLIHP